MAQRQFDFEQFGILTHRIPAGLGVFLALSLLQDVEYSFSKFGNPHEEEVGDIVQSLKVLRTQLKADAAAREIAGGTR